MSMPDGINLNVPNSGGDEISIMNDKSVCILNGELMTGVCSSKIVG